MWASARAEPGQRRLHVRRRRARRRHHGNGIDTRNPNATTAILAPGLAERRRPHPRRRLAAWAPNGGLDIQGTATPACCASSTTATRRIAGNLTVLGVDHGRWRRRGRLPRHPALCLAARRRPTRWTCTAAACCCTGARRARVSPSRRRCTCRDGATITQLRVYLTDSDATRNIQTFLLQDPLGTAGTPAIIATLATIGSAGLDDLTSGAR